MDSEVIARLKEQQARGVDLAKRFVFFTRQWQGKPNHSWNVPKILAELDAGGVDTSAIRTRLEEEGLTPLPQKEELPSHPPAG